MLNKKILKNWEWKKLGEVSTTIQTGGTPRRKVKEYWENGTIPWLKISDLKTKHIIEAEERINQKGLQESAAKIFPKGTIVYTIFATLGEVGILDLEAASNQAIAGIVPNNNVIDTEYMYYCLKAEKNNILKKKSHATQDNINLGILRNHEIPVPPLPIQRKIVSILERAEKLKNLRQEANEETNTVIQALFYDMFGDPVKNKKEWKISRVGEITLSHDSKRVPVKASSREKTIGQYPYYGASGIIDYVDDYIFDFDTILIAEDGANLISRSTPIAFKATGKYWVNNHAHVLTPKEELNVEFFLILLNLLDLKPYITGSAQPKLNAKALSNIGIIIPPISLQNQFASLVEKIESIKEHQTQSTEEINTLFDALMQKAFNGEIT